MLFFRKRRNENRGHKRQIPTVPERSYDPVEEAYRVLANCEPGDEQMAIDEALGYLGEIYP